MSGTIEKEVVHTEAIVKTAGRGTIYITIAKFYFILSGYSIYFALPRLLSADQFGNYGVITGIVAIINAVIVIGTQQAVSKFVSEDARRADAVKRQALQIQTVIGGAITAAYLLAAPLIADWVNDRSLIAPLRVSALIPFAYSFYSVYMGYLNGQRKFLRQSVLDMSYSTLKAAMIVVLALLLGTVASAVAGFGLSALVILFIAPFIAGRADNQIDEKPATATFLKFQFALLGFTLVNNLLQKIDLLLIKALGSSSSAEASEMAGYYTALMAIANITYQAIISIAFVIFPLVSNATFEARAEEVKSYIRETLKYTLMIMALGATVFSSNAAPVLGLLFRPTYKVGAPALAIAAYGMLFFGLIYILTTIISGSGRARVSFLIGLATLAVSATMNILLIPRYGIVGAAMGTTVSMAMGALVAALYVWRAFRATARLRSVISISIAAIAAYQIALILGGDRIYEIAVRIALQTIVYFIVLIATREIGKKEIAQIRKIASI